MSSTASGRVETDEVAAGDICAVVGLEDVDIGDTIADFENPVALPPITVDEPTLDMIFRINDSPFVGQEGTYVTSRQLRDRLMKELESNVALRVVARARRSATSSTSPAAGLLHLSILLENMRREGYELSVGKPRVITKEINGKTQEPIEYLVIEVPPASVGSVMELVGNRRAECLKLDARGEMTHIEFTIPARGLIGLRTRLHERHQRRGDHAPQLLRLSAAAREHSRPAQRRHDLDGDRAHHGVLPWTTCRSAASCSSAPAKQVYEGQIVGEHCRDNDLPVNVCREKKLTNMRAAGADKSIILKPPRQMTLELALEYIEDDELVEVTPGAIRLRKALLKEADRRRWARQA